MYQFSSAMWWPQVLAIYFSHLHRSGAHFSKVPKRCGKISNLMTIDLFYSCILDTNGGSLLQEISNIYTFWHVRLNNNLLKMAFLAQRDSRAFRKWAPGMYKSDDLSTLQKHHDYRYKCKCTVLISRYPSLEANMPQRILICIFLTEGCKFLSAPFPGSHLLTFHK